MKNVENMLRQAHDVLYDELNRNVREMTTDESNFIRNCLDKMDSWIKDAEGKFGRADASQSKRSVVSSNLNSSSFDEVKTFNEWYSLIEDILSKALAREGYSPLFPWNITVESKGKDWVYSHQMTKDEFIEFIITQTGVPYSYGNRMKRWFKKISSSCHGKSDKRLRDKKEDELESSSRRFMKSSPDMLLRNRAREIFRRFDDLSPDYQEDILIKFDVNDKDDLADYVMAYGNASAIDELDDAVAEAESKLYSSRNAKTFSKFNRISSLFIKNDVLKPGKTGIELDINGWKIINKDGKPTGGEAAEFNSEKAARDSEIFKKLVDRYGADKVRTFKQS